MSAIEATRGDQSSGYHIYSLTAFRCPLAAESRDQSSRYHIYSLTAFRCPLAAESRVHSHHRFVRSSPDSGGRFSDSPSDSQSVGSAIFYALDSGGGCVTQDVPPAAGPGLPRALPSQHFVLWADFKACASVVQCVVQ